MRNCHRKISYILAVIAAISAAAGCSGGSAPAQTTAAATTAAPVTTTTAADTGKVDTEPEAVSAPDDTTAPADADVSEESKPAVSDTGESTEESTDAPAESSAETETEPSVTETVTSADTAETTKETAAATTAATTQTTTTTTTTAAATTTTTTTSATTTTTTTTTTAATTPAPAAAPSPPQINAVSSPGVSTFKAENIVFDYSNAGLGYVSVDYSGTTRLKLLLKLGESRFDYDIYPGRGIQYITLAQGSGTYTVEIYEMMSNGKFINSVNESFKASIADEINMFTYRNFFVEFGKNSACVAKASEVCAGCTSALDKIAAVFRYVTDNITYDKEKAKTVSSGYIPDPDTVLAQKKGICFDYASLTAAMLRSQGVPTRLITGYANPDIYHAWNEVYTPATGWITVEIMLDGTGFKRIDATFYASAQNKKSFADYIANSKNYSNVYIY
jgi:transglutaminase/protease-like cytokinesis protein 3